MLWDLETLLCVEVNTTGGRRLHVGHCVKIFLANLSHLRSVSFIARTVALFRISDVYKNVMGWVDLS